MNEYKNVAEYLLNIIVSNDINDEKLIEMIKQMDVLDRTGLISCAKEKGYIELAHKISDISKKIRDKRLKEFKDSVNNGNWDAFLNNLSTKELDNLRWDINYHIMGDEKIIFLGILNDYLIEEEHKEEDKLKFS